MLGLANINHEIIGKRALERGRNEQFDARDVEEVGRWIMPV